MTKRGKMSNVRKRELKKASILLLLLVYLPMINNTIMAAAIPPPPANEVSVRVDPSQQAGAPGDVLSFNITVTNNGTVPDIIVVDSVTGIPAEWVVKLKANDEIVLLPYKTPLLQNNTCYNLSLDVHIPGEATSTTESICIEVHSYADSSKRDNATFLCVVEFPFFDTGNGAYPSIMGIHTGTIKPNRDFFVRRMYTYPCAGTGGHSEYIKIGNASWNASANWSGYSGDWQKISFNKSFRLEGGKTYNYTIRTGSYPQIIHAKEHKAKEGGNITCLEFIDANGKRYPDWIPAIRLE